MRSEQSARSARVPPGEMAGPTGEAGPGAPVPASPGVVTVRYWAAARAAAGTASDHLEVGAGTSLAQLLDAVRRTHPDRPRLSEVLAVCSVLVGDRPVGSADPSAVTVSPGDTVELLPPFAGG